MKKGFTLIELLIVVAIIAILAAIAVPNFLEAQVRSKASRVKADLRSLATAIESYYVDNNAYPATDSSDPAGNPTEGYGINLVPGASLSLIGAPTFRVKRDNLDNLMTLTTPVSYISSYFGDPFAKTRAALYLYSTPGSLLSPEIRNSGWIAWSYGPDADEQGAWEPPPANVAGDIPYHLTGSPRVWETYYNPANRVPSIELQLYATYDPTNGSTSNGDLYRTKQ